MSNLLKQLRLMLELVRFSHTIFALPFAILAMVMAFRVPLPGGQSIEFRWLDLLGVLLCMILARTSAMAFNRWIDHKFDAANPRTAGRHLPAGLMSRQAVLGLIIFSSIGFIASTLLFLPNRLPLYFAVPVLIFLLGYSLAKRFTSASHLWLGVALSLSPICVWIALRGLGLQTAGWSAIVWDLLPPVVLAVAIALWVTGFDIIYACQDAKYDETVGMHSIPARFGVSGGLRIAAALHASMVIVLALQPLTSSALGLGWLYYFAVLGIAGLLWYEHRLVSPQDMQRVGVAFFNVNAIVSVALLVAASVDCWL